MKTKLLTILLLLGLLASGCPKKSSESVAASSQPEIPAEVAAPIPETPPQPVEPAVPLGPPLPAEPVPGGPNLSLALHVKFLQDILSGLCVTGYQIYLGDPENWIVFRELKHLQMIPVTGEAELAMKLDFCVKKYGIKYQDQAEATIRMKLATVKKNGKIFLQGSGKAITIKTRFGETMDESVLLPRINKELTKGPLFEVDFSDIVHIIIPWPKLGDSARITELKLTDAFVEIQYTAVIFHMTVQQETKLP